MEGARRTQPEQPNDGRGRRAENPAQIPKPGWRDILIRVKNGISEHNVSIVAAGAGFFLLLGLVPGLGALISLYGLVANPSDIESQFNSISGVMPSDVRNILEGQMKSISSQHHAAGFAAVVSIVLALWGGASAVKTLMSALNIVYREEEKRGYLRLSLVALGLTVVFVALGIISIGLIVALPTILSHIGLGGVAQSAGTAVRWPLLLIVALVALGLLYRYGPSRQKPKWKWVSPGAVLATVLWVGGSVLFAFYAAHFGSYNKTYGSLGAVVVLMMWLYISAFVVLLGAEINAEIEHQTAQDTTTGEPKPLGRRGAYVADTVGKRAK
jgi:membrane protein